MNSDSRQPVYVRMHNNAFHVYMPDEADRSDEITIGGDDDDELESDVAWSYVHRVVHDPVEVARLIAPNYRLAGPNDGCFNLGTPVPEELLNLVRVQLDFWPLPPLVQHCFHAPLVSDVDALSG